MMKTTWSMSPLHINQAVLTEEETCSWLCKLLRTVWTGSRIMTNWITETVYSLAESDSNHCNCACKLWRIQTSRHAGENHKQRAGITTQSHMALSHSAILQASHFSVFLCVNECMNFVTKSICFWSCWQLCWKPCKRCCDGQPLQFVELSRARQKNIISTLLAVMLREDCLLRCSF